MHFVFDTSLESQFQALHNSREGTRGVSTAVATQRRHFDKCRT